MSEPHPPGPGYDAAQPPPYAGAYPLVPGRGPQPPDTRRNPLLVVPFQVLAILVLFVAAGVGCGVLWEHLWTVPHGVVTNHVWIPTGSYETFLRKEFSAVGLFVVIGVPAGLVLGGLCSWLLARSELASLAAVAAGSVVAAYVMMRVGVHLSPADPDVAAKTAADGTKLLGDLRLPHHHWAPYACLPLGALAASSLVLFTPRRRRR